MHPWPRPLLRSLYNTFTGPSPRRGAGADIGCARGGAMPASLRRAGPPTLLRSLFLLLLPGPFLVVPHVDAAADPGAPDAVARARQVLAAVREALGGEVALAALHALSLEGQLRRSLPGDAGPAEMAGSIRVDVLP